MSNARIAKVERRLQARGVNFLHADRTGGETDSAWRSYLRARAEGDLVKARSILSTSAKIIAGIHDAGVVYREFGTGDILMHDGEPAPANLKRAAAAIVTRRKRAVNLAHLNYEVRQSTTRTERLRFLKRYLDHSDTSGTLRGWVFSIERHARHHAIKRNAAHDRLITGDNQHFVRLKLPGGWRGHAVWKPYFVPRWSQLDGLSIGPAQWRDLLSHPESLFDSSGQVVKECGVSMVLRRRISLGGRELEVYIKRPKRKHWWKVLVDCFRLSRSVRAFRLGWKLLNRRIGTAVPLVAVEKRTGLFLRDSILITEAVNAPALDKFLRENLDNEPGGGARTSDDPRRRMGQDVLAQMGRLLRRLYENNFAHRDLKASNMLIHQEGEKPPQIVLVDLDGLSHRWRLTARRRFQGLMRLNVSLLQCPTVNHAGRLRMLMSYLRKPGCGRINFKPYWRALERWSSRKIARQIRSRRKDASARHAAGHASTRNAT